MARQLYSALFYLLMPLIFLRLLWRSLKAPAYRKRIKERFGYCPIEVKPNTLWIHCVSVGETLAAAPLIEGLLAQQPGLQLLITSTTPTGSDQVKRLFGERVDHCYAPYDTPDCVGRFLKRTKPMMAIVIETEVWPNIIHACQKRQIPTALINARMSLKSYRGYKRLNALSQPMFAALVLTTAQSTADAEHLGDLGASNITVTGSVKNDFSISDAMHQQAKQEKAQWQQQRGEPLLCLIAASTHTGEDEIILDAFKEINQQHSNTLLLLVPRHPERFDAAYQLSQQKGFISAKRTDGALKKGVQVLIVDTMGELQMLFGAADIAIMGGTFIDNGGHNFLEPAAWGLPILSGKSLFNFAAISDALITNKALTTVEDTQALATAALALINNTSMREKRGSAAQHYVEQNRGAVAENIALLKPLLGPVDTIE